jgi:hypothetical protein
VSKNELKKRAKQLEKEKKAAEKAAKQAELAKQREAADAVYPYLYRSYDLCLQLRKDDAVDFYGKLPLNQSQTRTNRPRSQIADFAPALDGQKVLFRARVNTSRAQGNKMVFLNLRQRTDSVQALLTVAPGKVSKQMAKWAAGLAIESIVLVEGIIQKSPEPIKSASVSDVEVLISQVNLWFIERST